MRFEGQPVPQEVPQDRKHAEVLKSVGIELLSEVISGLEKKEGAEELMTLLMEVRHATPAMKVLDMAFNDHRVNWKYFLKLESGQIAEATDALREFVQAYVAQDKDRAKAAAAHLTQILDK